MAAITSGSEIALEGLQGQPKLIGLTSGGWVVFGARSPIGNETWTVSQQAFSANGVSMGDAAVANTSATTGASDVWAAAPLSSGGWVLVWLDGDDNLQQQAFTSGGGNAGTTVQVNLSNNDSNGIGEVLGVGNGRWLVSWSGDAVDGSGAAVLQHLYNASDTPAASQARVNTTTAGDQLFNDVALLPDGDWITVYGTPGTGGADIAMRRSNSDGSLVSGNETIVNTTVAGVQAGGRIAVLNNGQFVVSWVDALAKVRLQHFDSSGTALGGEKVAGGTDGQFIFNHAIEALDEGGWVEVWTQSTSTETRVFQRVYGGDSTAVADAVQVSTTTVNSAFVGGFIPVPVVTAIDGGGWVVAWTLQDDDGQGIVQQVYNADGSPNGGETRVNEITAGVQTAPKLLRIESGWVVAWETEKIPDTRDEYVAQRIYHIDLPTIGEPPTDITGKLKWTEGTKGIVGTLKAVDADDNSGFTWALLDDAGGRFKIDAATGKVSVAKPILLDYEQAKNHSITVKVTDGDGNTFTKVLTAKGTDVAMEDLSLTGKADKVFGGSQVDEFNGLGGDDTLRGGGGKDTLDGGKGKDTADYSDKTKAIDVTLNKSTAVTVKVDGKAEDTIKNIESVIGGSKADALTGDGASNTFYGRLGKDVLEGKGGKDFFVFDSTLGKKHADTIADFKPKDDTILLDHTVFTSLGLGPLAGDAFVANATGEAADDTDRIVYNTSNGKLFYDADGLDGSAGIQFAVLTGKPVLTATDFEVV